MSVCRFCRREIRWCRLIEGVQNIALEIAPSPDGSYAVAGADSAMLVPKAGRAGRVLYHKHSETCPRADEAAAYYRAQHARPRAHGAARRAMSQLGDGPTHVWPKPR